MKEEKMLSIESRIALIKEHSEDIEGLKKHCCSFFQSGGFMDCTVCMQKEEDVNECKDYYLEHINTHPQLIWTPEFDCVKVEKRELVSIDDIVGIGINCDCCYMADKCPLHKEHTICGINWKGKKPETYEEFMDFLIDIQYQRVQRTAVYEKLDGGVVDVNLSSEMDRLNSLLYSKEDARKERLSISVEAKGDGASQGGGILAQLFGGGSK